MQHGRDDYRVLFESAPDLLFRLDLQGRIECVNRAFERFTGYDRHELRGVPLARFAARGSNGTLEKLIADAANGAPCTPCETEFATKDGSILPVEIAADSIRTEAGTVEGIFGYARDVRRRYLETGARQHAEKQLLEKTRQLAQFTRYLELLHRLSTTSFPAIDDLFAEYLRAGCEMFNLPNGVVARSGDRGVVAQWPPAQSTPSGWQCCGDVFATGATVVQSRRGCAAVATPIIVNRQQFGAIVFWSESTDAAPPHPQSRELVELMAEGIASALHQRQLTDELAHQATHDALTGLPNRLLLSERLAAALNAARVAGTQVAVLFIDLDRFKGINDTLGHSVGDAVLQQIAARLRACVREGDTLARMGGDEFTAILTSVSGSASALEAANELLAAVREPCRVEEYELFVSASIGVAFYPRDGLESTTLLRNADAAMYAAKYRGRNEVQCYTAEVTAMAMERLSLETNLRRALERNELRILYQGQYDLHGTLAGLEVLLEWNHPRLGRVTPSQFIPIAEETGMILPIGAWVLREACTRMADWRERLGLRVPVAVNVSALQFAQGNFVSVISDTLASTGLPAEALELEITESLVMRDVEQSTALLRDIRRLGARIAIDDFGTGYSSLSYLRQLPLDSLKVDQSFLQSPREGESALALVRAIVVLGHTLGLSVIAEGVETEQQFDLIRRAGCDRVQGHLFGTPLDAASFEYQATSGVRG